MFLLLLRWESESQILYNSQKEVNNMQQSKSTYLPAVEVYNTPRPLALIALLRYVCAKNTLFEQVNLMDSNQNRKSFISDDSSHPHVPRSSMGSKVSSQYHWTRCRHSEKAPTMSHKKCLELSIELSDSFFFPWHILFLVLDWMIMTWQVGRFELRDIPGYY